MASPLPRLLSPAAARVLGALLEKDIATPEYYPLSLHALQAACNQKSNREPMMALEEDELRRALHQLQELGLAAAESGSRVDKFRHRAQDVLNLTRAQNAVLCELLLRGAQTPGELRSHAARLHPFADLEEVEAVLRQLLERDPPLAVPLPRAPGTKEIRYLHLLSGPPEATSAPPAPPLASGLAARVEALEHEVADLRRELDALRPPG